MLVLLTMSVLGGGVAACGGSSDRPGSGSHASTLAAATSSDAARTSSTVPPGGYLKSDSDGDADERQKGPSSEDMRGMTATGHSVSGADRRAITTVVKSYYLAAAAGDGAQGCPLLDSSLATATTEEQSQLVPNTTKTCAASLSRLFEQQHQHLAAEEPTTMVVTGVHVNGATGLATLGFRTMPESEIVLQRKGRTWKIDALFDSLLP
jgi:hypothetical protein